MLQSSRLRLAGLLFLACSLAPMFVASLIILAQPPAPSRTFVLEDQRNNDPIQLVGFRIDGKMVSAGTPFPATDEDWLRDSAMIVTNVSKKEIVAVYVFMFFPESGATDQPMVGDQISAGSPPPEGMYTHEGKKLDYHAVSQLSLEPGQTLEIPLGQHFSGFRGLLEKRKTLKEFSVCHVRFVNVYFANGMKWSPNYFGRPDPDHRGQYIQIRPSEFYDYHPSSNK